jgi:hypothetical protein
MAFIVVHPLPIGLFAVSILTARDIQADPGFVAGVVLARRVLPSFVRQAVLGIRIAALDANSPYQFPPTEVTNELRAIIKAHATGNNMTPQERQVAFFD